MLSPRGTLVCAIALLGFMGRPTTALNGSGNTRPSPYRLNQPRGIQYTIPRQFFNDSLQCVDEPVTLREVEDCAKQSQYAHLGRMRKVAMESLGLPYKYHNPASSHSRGFVCDNPPHGRFREFHNGSNGRDGSNVYVDVCYNASMRTGSNLPCDLQLVEPCNFESSLEFYDGLIMERDDADNLKNANIAELTTILAFGSAYFHGSGCGGLPQAMDAGAIKLLFAYFLNQLAPNAAIGGFQYSTISTYINPTISSFGRIDFPRDAGGFLDSWADVFQTTLNPVPGYVETAVMLIKVALSVCDPGFDAAVEFQLASLGFNVSLFQTFNVSMALDSGGQFNLRRNGTQCNILIDLADFFDPSRSTPTSILGIFVGALQNQEEFSALSDSPVFNANQNHPRGQSVGPSDCSKFPHWHWHKDAASVISKLNALIKDILSTNIYPTDSPTRAPTRPPTAQPTWSPNTPPIVINGSCMSGDTEVLQTAASPANTASGVESRPELERVRVADLQIGSTVMGIGEDKAPRECEVVSVGRFGRGTLFGNYTADHFVVSSGDGGVEFSGAHGFETIQPKFLVLTTCPAGTDASGVHFTAMDGDFCGNERSAMPWLDYLKLYAVHLPQQLVAHSKGCGSLWGLTLQPRYPCRADSGPTLYWSGLLDPSG
eukprot:m.340186 g.340186  ORF g.340186 m.340186 type:complete len:657 (+) comp27825_c1_seq2:305-2275(+)